MHYQELVVRCRIEGLSAFYVMAVDELLTLSLRRHSQETANAVCSHFRQR